MELREGRGGGRGERRRRPPRHRVRSASRARCGEARARAPVGARGDGWGRLGDVGATQGGGRRAARPPRGRGRRAATPGRGPGARSARRGKGTWAVENRAPRGHVRWGRGLFGERACGGGWRPAGGEGRRRGSGLARPLRRGCRRRRKCPLPEAALGVGGRMAECGRGPHGSAGTPPPQIPATGSPGRPATWWAGAGNPPARGEGVLANAQGSLEFWGGGKPEARILITPESPLRAYVSAPQPHGPPELSPQLRCEVRRPAGVSSAFPCRAAGEAGRPRRLDGSPAPTGRADSAVGSRAQSSAPRPVRFTLSLPAPLRRAGERRRRPPGRTSTTH